MQDTVDRAALPPAPRREGVQAIARAGRVLRALEAAPDGLALGELSRQVELPKSTVHRLVAALAAEDLLSATAGTRIRLGGGLIRLGSASRQALGQRVRPVLEELRAKLDETVDLAVLDGATMRFVDQLPAARRLRAVSAVGASFPLHCTANGKALLAAMPEEQALALLPSPLPLLTANTITERSELRDQLAQTRARGVAFDHEEHTEGISATGAALLDEDGPVAAISVPVPTSRFRGNEARYTEAIGEAALQASRLLSDRTREAGT
jgi:DNA-binding IclR family transcriptional regulator